MIYFHSHDLIVRDMEQEDIEIFYNKYCSYGWNPNKETYIKYYQEQAEKKRMVFIAEYQGMVAGICTLVLNPGEGPFGNQEIPEIVDFGVFKEMRNLGIGTALLDTVEKEASKLNKKVYLAVGVHSGYGAAQRLYVKRGYIPDGSGVWYQDKPLEQYAVCKNDDELLLFFSKDI